MKRTRRSVHVGLVLAAGLTVGGLSGCNTSAKGPSGLGSSNTAGMQPGLPGVPGSSAEPGTPGVPTGSTTTPVVTDPSAPIVPVEPFDAFTPQVYATKVKDLLTGLPLTDAEYLRVNADPTTLKELIGEWMTLPSFKTKMLEFFTQAFQQDGAEITDLNDQYGGVNIQAWPARDLFLKSLSGSFARTGWELVVAGDQPFTQTVTTRSFMLNLPLMIALSYIDAAPVSDVKTNSVEVPWLLPSNTQMAQFLSTADGNAAIPLSDTLNPQSPNYMKWTYTPVAGSPCGPATKKGPAILVSAFQMMMGFGPVVNCKVETPFTDADWSTYKLVTIRRPTAAEKKTAFWDPSVLRNANELVLDTDRIGFMTTPAFFGRWATNDSNMFRVTVNQSLIVALGRSIEPIGTAIPLDDSNLQGEHAAPGTPCYACHVTLDPAREFFHQSYSVYYSRRLSMDTKLGKPVPPTSIFTVFNSPALPGNGISDLANGIVQHPGYATAWVQKFCEYANSGDCSADDPELTRIGNAFKAGGYRLKDLITETFSSPVVTFAQPTKTSTDFGPAVGIARREVFCARLTERLGIVDACNAVGQNSLGTSITKAVTKLALGVPNAGFARGEPRAILPRDPNLFFSNGTEKICSSISSGLIGSAMPKWAPTQKDAAFNDFVSIVMGVPPSDPRFTPLLGVLSSHYDQAIAAQAKDTDALRSTFVVACSSPLGVSSGL